MLNDFLLAVRNVFKRPAFAATIVIVLALGIGANSAVFSVIDAVLLKPLPFPQADRLVSVFEFQPSGKLGAIELSPVHLDEWNRLNHTFDGIAGCYFENITETSGPAPERVTGMRVSEGFFQVLGAAPALGRWLLPEESKVGGPLGAVISDAFWQRRFSGDRNVIGKTLRLGVGTYTIVGVMPPSFRYPNAATEVWSPAQFGPDMMKVRSARFYTTVGRLKPGVSAQQAQADLTTVEQHLAEQFPQDKGWESRVNALKEEQVGEVRSSLWLLFGAVGLLLLIACGNVACLMLAQASDRQREISIRFALGASRAIVLRQLLIEGLVLALVGGAAGLAIAYQGVGLLRHAAIKLPRVAEIEVDYRIVAFTFLACIASTLLFALTPALMAAGKDRSAELAQGGYWQAGSRQRLPRALVSCQIALAIILLVGSGLLLRSFARLSNVALGFEPSHILTFRVSAAWGEDGAKVSQRQLRTLAAVATLPGVESSAMGIALPGAYKYTPAEFQIVGRKTANGDSRRTFAAARAVSSDYFRTLGIPVLSGETCRMNTDPNQPSELLVNRRFADQYFSGENAVGHSVQSLLRPGSPSRIIGITGDSREDSVSLDPQPTIYYCGTIPYFPDPSYMIKTAGSPAAAAADVREALRKLDPSRAVYAVNPLADSLAETLAPQRFNTLLLGLFAATALLLASVGLYGVMSYFVARRKREIGIRMAIGARPGQILRAVMQQAAILTAAGVAVGLAGAAALTSFIQTMLFGVQPRDAVTFVSAPLLLMLVAFLACSLPAHRASRVNPMVALRDE